jgi:hypothetical protein
MYNLGAADQCGLHDVVVASSELILCCGVKRSLIILATTLIDSIQVNGRNYEEVHDY